MLHTHQGEQGDHMKELLKWLAGLAGAAIIALAGFTFDANTRISVLEAQAQNQMTIANENKENFRRLNEGIARLNIVLTVLNDRLSREDDYPNQADIIGPQE